MFTNLVGIWRYVAATLALAAVLFGVLAGIQTSRLHTANAKLDTVQTKLDVSNASIDDLSKQLKQVLLDLQTAQVHDQQSQEALHQALVVQQQKDQSLVQLEEKLRNNTNGSRDPTPIPEDIVDAWKAL